MRRGSLILLAIFAPASAQAPDADRATARVLAAIERLVLAPTAPPLADRAAIDDAAHRRALLDAFRTGLADRDEAPVPLAPSPAPERGLMNRLADLPPPASRPASPPPRPSGLYRLPTQGSVVIGMGEQLPTGWRARGLTIAPAPGGAVVAPAPAYVAYAGSFGGYGRIVILDHGHGWTTLLTGLSRVAVRVGDPVGQGDRLGQVGRASPRLTIELRHRGRPVDVAAMALS